MHELCKKYDIIYISDEVVTAFGRCGHWFASNDEFGVIPDIVTFAKGVTSGYVPLGGFAISDALIRRVSGLHAKGVYFTNGYTYSGHPVACAAALANLRVIEHDRLLEHVRLVAPLFQSKLAELSASPIVRDVRGIGLIACVECGAPNEPAGSPRSQKLVERIDRHCFDLGLIVRPIGNMCVLSPPLVI